MQRSVVRQSPAPNRRAPRGPAGLYGAVSFGLIAAIASVALTTTQPPPTIAEFAPQAAQRITSLDPEGSSSSGGTADAHAAAGREPPADRAADPAAADVARVRRCVGDPPRQIEDPQSPPCVPYWSGDNGGATSRGVTRDEVRVASAYAPNRALERFFNARFEFYGRELRLIDTSTDGGSCSPAGRRSKAVAAVEQRNVFASLPDIGCGDGEYSIALAERGIISTSLYQGYTEAMMMRHSPYMWSYLMAMDAAQHMQAEWACARFAGRPARYAKGADANRKRVFGVFSHSDSPDLRVDTTPLRDGLARCGQRSVASFEVSVSWDSFVDPATYAGIMLQMREAGVTTIFCLCHAHMWQQLGAAGTSNGYFPEWLIGTYAQNDYNFFIRIVTPEQRSQAMGFTFQPRLTRFADDAAFWAEAEGDPAAPAKHHGTDFYEKGWLDTTYRSMLLIAAGIQMAGPALTATTFEAGLHRTDFPNPDHPIKAGEVGFPGRRHSMTLDAAEYWWSNTAAGPDSDRGEGAICYVDNGDRRAPGYFPSGDEPFFSGPCDSGA